LGGRGRRIESLRTIQAKVRETLSQKQKQKDCGIAQMVECFPSKHEVLGSIFSTGKKERFQHLALQFLNSYSNFRSTFSKMTHKILCIFETP
jgi:hypothetical protein